MATVTESKKRKASEELVKNDVLLVSSLKRLKDEFSANPVNKIVQNSLCSNGLCEISEVREYMQSRDFHFSHTIEPKLEVTNQGLSGRCWMFAVLNVIRYEIIRDMRLPYDFEFSESYLSFYEKMEKCNYFLSQFIDDNNVDPHDLKTRERLFGGVSEGGRWITCVNLIKKYGLVPKVCYLESVNSFSTGTLNKIIDTKLREFALTLTQTEPKSRNQLKSQMMEQIYQILSKMLGTPPTPNEEFEWSFVPKLDATELFEIDKKRNETGMFETLEIKKTIRSTPLDFYKNYVSHNLDDYLSFSNDPRNTYGKYYESFDDDVIMGSTKSGYYNVDMDSLTLFCMTSILNNTPVQFSCDVGHYMHPDHELFDNKCFDYNLLFGVNFDSLSKEQMLQVCESYPNHAMVLVGVDLDENGYPTKWKVENSWGRSYFSQKTHEDDYYTMSHEWFKRYAYDAVIHKDYVGRPMCVTYNNAVRNKVTLPENDMLG